MNETLEYWKRRCLSAENYIQESPSDPDITKTQYEAYEKWLDIVNENEESRGNE